MLTVAPIGCILTTPNLITGCAMELHHYHVHYWSAVEWNYVEYDVIAESEAQVRAKVDAECVSEHRLRAYVKESERKDTLEIENRGAITLPYVLNT
jgi:hypothetical protein